MSDIQHLADLDYRALFTSVIIFMAGWVALKALLVKFSEATGIEMPWTRRDRERAEQVDALQKRVDAIDLRVIAIADSVTAIQNIVEGLSETVNSLKERQDENEAARLKDRISQSYQYYHERQEWTEMEKEAFTDLIKAYTEYSDNSFVHTICEPEAALWRVIER